MFSWFLRVRCCLPFQRWKWQRLARLPPACTKSLRALLRSADDVPGQQTNKLLRAQQEKTGKMREEKQDTLPIIFILLCSLLGSASRVQVAVRLRCELAYDINGMRQRRGGAVRT